MVHAPPPVDISAGPLLDATHLFKYVHVFQVQIISYSIPRLRNNKILTKYEG